jgi:hypothetical protein
MDLNAAMDNGAKASLGEGLETLKPKGLGVEYSDDAVGSRPMPGSALLPTPNITRAGPLR